MANRALAALRHALRRGSDETGIDNIVAGKWLLSASLLRRTARAAMAEETALPREYQKLKREYAAHHQANQQQEETVHARGEQAAGDVPNQTEKRKDNDDEGKYGDFKHGRLAGNGFWSRPDKSDRALQRPKTPLVVLTC